MVEQSELFFPDGQEEETLQEEKEFEQEEKESEKTITELSSNTVLTPYDTAKIDIIVKPMTISKLLDRLENDELQLDPDFQRASNLWDNKRRSRLIESVILKIPLPSFYFNEDDKGNYSVVDGLQRLSAIFQFINSKELSRSLRLKIDDLKLTDMQYLTDLNGKTYNEIPRHYKRAINELEITSTIIRPSTPDLVRFNIFARLNQGGLAVNGQEIRNAIYPGIWRSHVSKISNSEKFLEYTENKVSKKRLMDHQMVLRVFALFATNGKRFDKNILDDFLNYTLVEYILKWSSERWEEEEIKFIKGMKNTKAIYGKNAFRKLDSSKSSKLPINKTIFEIQVYLLGSGVYNEDQINKLISNKDAVIEYTENEMKNNRSFLDALSSNTGSDSSYSIRKAVFENIFKKYSE
ncbi:DUF262 domain-containing protein [Acinetobacter baumannii]|uniref:DUF262 domain-containing protein n=1 Tax=Acinetobacter baumannii TaxID=470 RepID=UPI00135F6D3A|nr:DUF262 domain-containing protein [Acinetobacter baumannii]MDC4633242.1 DUF262 domain-containing protein [Acinetobacter baumannii]MDI7719666.1 DUF262 domain-containing protein [Acinetobacter baumannii]MDT1910737.1 DUF262 domain-containing protein [Acinetobacter baumannii]MDV4302563.1 DUF262 domain-containing protein [Acinetobacter baumannii]MDV7474040.1 DUF262 domain-containing protein [Acinetobacter baumannii]